MRARRCRNHTGFARTTHLFSNLPPSARFGLSCQAGLLTRLHPPLSPSRITSVACEKDIRLTALGTFRFFTEFPILPPQGRAPDEKTYDQEDLRMQVS